MDQLSQFISEIAYNQAVAAEPSHHRMVQYALCTEQNAEFNIYTGQYDPLCTIWLQIGTVWDRQWFQGIFLTIGFAVNIIFWGIVLYIFWVAEAVRTTFQAGSADMVRYNVEM